MMQFSNPKTLHSCAPLCFLESETTGTTRFRRGLVTPNQLRANVADT
jgi:hypothetical protein